VSGQQQLTLGALDLLGENDYGFIEALGDDGTWGAPQPIEVTLQSLLQDGSIVVTQGYDNREASLRVRLRASDSAALASLEAMLFAEIGKRNSLTWTPPDGWGPPTVFEVITSHMEHTFDDLSEALRSERVYGITFTCEPFARSAEPFTVVGATTSDPSTPTPPPPTTVSTGSSTTNWTSSAGPTTVASTLSSNPLLRMAYNKNAVQSQHVYEYTAIMSVGSQRYLVLDWAISGVAAYMVSTSPAVEIFGASAGGSVDVSLVRVAQMLSPDNSGYTRTLWQIPDNVVTISRIRFTATMATLALNATKDTWGRGFSIRLVQLASQALSSGTSRQKVMSVSVPGSAPMVGSLQVSHPSTPLGDLLVYSWADDGSGYAPPLRPRCSSKAAGSADPSLYSGEQNPLSSPIVYRVPMNQLPRGLYVFYARLKRVTAGTVTVKVDGTARTASDVSLLTSPTVSRSVALTTDWQIVPLGRMQLPTADVTGGYEEISVSTATNDGAVFVDEVYACNVTIGRTTIVSAASMGAGGPLNVWVNSPTTDIPRPSVTAGVQPDGSDAYNIEAQTTCEDPHRWQPPSVNVFTACAALDATTTLTGYARWHTHAADDSAA